MRKLLYIIGFLLISIPTMAQKYPFSQKWKEVQTQLDEGKTKAVEPLLKEIYLAAKQENQTDDLIKALIFKSNIAVQTSDDENIVIQTENEILQEIAQNKSIDKAVLQSILAELYFNYYQENYYRFQDRTDVANNASNDFRTWTTEKFLHEVDTLLQASINNQADLYRTELNSISLLLQGKDDFRYLQPTVYDILAKRALKIYENDRFNAQEFDQKTKNAHIDKIYADLVQLHRSDNDKSALIQNNIDQLLYLKQKSDNFDLTSELLRLDKKYKSEPWSTNILATLATVLLSEDKPTEAIETCHLAQKRFPNTFGAKRALSIQKEIEYPVLSFNTDATFFANQHNPLNIIHKNVDKIYYQVYRLNNSQFAKNKGGFEYDYKSKKINIIGDLVLNNTIQLKAFKDYKSHTTHIPFLPIEPGNYVILISNNDNFTGEINHHLFQAAIKSTYIDLSTRTLHRDTGSVQQGQIADKSTGLPLKNQSFSLLKSFNNGPFEKIKNLITDDLGRFELDEGKRNYQNTYAIQLAQEKTIFLVNPYTYRNPKSKDEWVNDLKIFTDRAIYRPGQTVYFKGILYQSKEKENRIAKNQKIEITLQDTNDEELTKLDLVSNEFGSVHGEFILPSSGLTGEFYIEDNWADSSYTFLVEEYKRPKFQVELDTLKGVYKLNQEVKVSGTATTFSGANVTEAKVVYRVFRKSFDPYGWGWWRPMSNEEVDMISGETTTDENGVFNFDFTALPKENEKEGKRAYNYRIVTDITDVSGETHSVEGNVRIGDIPLTLNLLAKDKISVEEFSKIKISVQNLNGIDTEASGEFSITEIKKLDRVLRYGQTKVDYELLEKQDFISKLPYIAYDNENLLENRERGNMIVTKDWNTSTSDTIIWNQKIPVGIYELKATSIYKNDTIESVKIIEVFEPNFKTTQNTYFDVILKKSSLQPGDKAELTFISDAENAHVLVELEVDGKIVKKEILNLNNSKEFSFQIKEEYRGGVFVHVYFNKFNESTSKILSIQVPYENKQLDFAISTLRNKLEPGEDETWTLTLKDKKGDKFLAEVLASMYDKSLDEFVTNPYHFSPYQNNYSIYNHWESGRSLYFRNLFYRQYNDLPSLEFEELNLFGLTLNEFRRGRLMSAMKSAAPVPEILEDAAEDNMDRDLAGNSEGIELEQVVSLGYATIPDDIKEKQDLAQVEVRKNLQETAFFFPNLKTDEKGNVKIEFTTPESLTQWNFQAVAHTKDLKTGTFQADVVTQKELMVVPNAPRFLREGDQLTFKTKVINLSDKDLRGNAQLLLFDAFSMQPIEGKFELTQPEHDFSVKSGGNSTLSWNLKVPNVDEVQSVVYRVVASTGEFSDGEENALPILTNRMMVTETMPIHVRENQSKTFTFDKLANTTSDTRDNYKLTMEMTTNPIWYAVMALPYLREYPYDCSEQVFARFYGNLLSQSIMNSNPKIKAVFDDWNKKGQLISPLEKNQELKNILLEETPWARDAQSEAEQMKRIAVLFDLNKMRNELQDTYRKLEQKQSDNGGFAWFEGGRENVYITTHIVAGFGHLAKMGINENSKIPIDLESIPSHAIEFIDAEMEKNWDKFQSDKKRYSLSAYDGLYWLYARSYFLKTEPLNPKLQKAKDYFLSEMDKDKFNQNLQTQGLLALTLHRFGQTKKAKDLILSIKDRAVESDEMGMYWKENVSGYRWYEAPVETQALIIEAFDEILPDDIESVESMKVWLLKNKQTNQWISTKATTEAVYALMNTGKDWSNAEDGVTVKIGGDVWLSPSNSPKGGGLTPSNTQRQTGSGYVKTSWDKSEISPNMATVEVEKTSPGVAWGAMYWQYFENLDKITDASTNVRFKKQLFIQHNTAQGPKLFEITPTSPIGIGDLVKVRLEIQTDRAMEFVHIKDMRASGFEPVNVLSTYKWQDGLGYYESTRDAATNFFIDYLPKGVYVFEYELRANNAGIFSNGITQLQNMYAPEFTAHSAGLEVIIK